METSDVMVCLNWDQHDNCERMQPMLPLEQFHEFRCASGWCAPSEPEYSITGGIDGH